MKNFLIPSGVAYFPGPYMDLLRVVGKMWGTLENENTFHCKVAFPPKNREGFSFVRVRGHLDFLFQCSIERCEDSCKIAYQVYPTFSSAIFLLVTIFVLFSGFVYAESQQIIENFVARSILSGVFLALWLLARRSCIRQFIRKFEEEYESNFD